MHLSFLIYFNNNSLPVSNRLKLFTDFYSKTKEMHQIFKFILFCSSNLHVSDGLSVHHQESKTVHTHAFLTSH